jgi:hypothetical protein
MRPRIVARIVCAVRGHKPGEFVDVAIGKVPEGEPTLDEFKKWTRTESDVIGTAAGDSNLRCERCGKKLRKCPAAIDHGHHLETNAIMPLSIKCELQEGHKGKHKNGDFEWEASSN